MSLNEKVCMEKPGSRSLSSAWDLCRVCATLGGCKRDWRRHRGHRMGDQTLQTRSLGLRWSKFDLIIVLSLLWTVASALLRRTSHQCGEAPGVVVRLLFYLARATSREDRRWFWWRC